MIAVDILVGLLAIAVGVYLLVALLLAEDF